MFASAVPVAGQFSTRYDADEPSPPRAFNAKKSKSRLKKGRAPITDLRAGMTHMKFNQGDQDGIQPPKDNASADTSNRFKNVAPASRSTPSRFTRTATENVRAKHSIAPTSNRFARTTDEEDRMLNVNVKNEAMLNRA